MIKCISVAMISASCLTKSREVMQTNKKFNFKEKIYSKKLWIEQKFNWNGRPKHIPKQWRYYNILKK